MTVPAPSLESKPINQPDNTKEASKTAEIAETGASAEEPAKVEAALNAIAEPPITQELGMAEAMSQPQQVGQILEVDPPPGEPITGTPAEGMDTDPRFAAIKQEMTQQWLALHPGQDLLSEEGQNYNLGHMAPEDRDKPTLTSDTINEFRKRYPEDAALYDIKERTRVYDNAAHDPAIKAVEALILKQTNFDPLLKSNNSLYSGETSSERWNRVYSRAARSAYDSFVLKYPEKAQAYAAQGHVQLRQALERQERAHRQTEKPGGLTGTPATEDAQQAEPPNPTADSDSDAQEQGITEATHKEPSSIPVPELQGGDDVAKFAESLVTALRNKDISEAQYKDARDRALHSPTLRGNTASLLFAQAEIAGGTEIIQTLYGGTESTQPYVVQVPKLQGGDDVAQFAESLTTALANRDITPEQYEDARQRALRQPTLQTPGTTAPSLFAEALVYNKGAMGVMAERTQTATKS